MTLQRTYSDKQALSWRNRGKVSVAKQKTLMRKARNRCHWDYEFRGNMGAAFDDALKNHEEILLCGAAGTGKTLRVLSFINRVMWEYPGARVLIVRKVRADLAQSTLVTYERDVMGLDNPIVSTVQRNSRQSYKYPNGSEIVVGGMDRPGRVLSAEYDIIYAAEAVQFTLNDWETLIMRLRSGPYPWPMIIGDTNPDRPDHWIKQRADGGMIKLLNTYHKDNPRYWDAKLKRWTEMGLRYVMGKLQRLTGVRRKRYLDNQWVIAEGAVYDEWNDDVHLIDADNLPHFIRRWRSIDFGYRNPFVCQWWGEDADNRLYLYREIYQTELLVSNAAIEIVRLEAGLSRDEIDNLKDKFKDFSQADGRFWRELWSLARSREPINGTIADHDSEDRATLALYGIPSIAARKAVSTGIESVKSRMVVQPDGKPRFFITRGALVTLDDELRASGRPAATHEEIGGYVWHSKSKKEEPIKEDDHGVDAARYMVMYFDDPNLSDDKPAMRQSRSKSGRSQFKRRR